jgi:hypothetical protein
MRNEGKKKTNKKISHRLCQMVFLIVFIELPILLNGALKKAISCYLVYDKWAT